MYPLKIYSEINQQSKPLIILIRYIMNTYCIEGSLRMIETVYNLYQGDEFKIEKLVMKQNGHYIHMVFPKGEGLPLHVSNAELFMTVLRGTLSLGLDEQDIQTYEKGTMLNIPFQTKMNVRNENDEVLELLVVKVLPEGKDKI